MDDHELFSDSEERPRIKVTDRRKFAADGTPRSGEPPDADTADNATDAASAADAADVKGAAHLEFDASAPAAAAGNEEIVAGTDTPPAAEPGEDKPHITAPQPDIADLPRDFSTFVERMYLETMLYLGALPDPRSGQVMEDIELAQYKIDVLSMIQAKTQGNLTDDEKQQLDEALYQLRTVYLQTMKAADS